MLATEGQRLVLDGTANEAVKASMGLSGSKAKGRLAVMGDSPVPYGPGAAKQSHEAWTDVVVIAHVLMLLLTPHQLGTRVLLCLPHDQVKRER